MVSGRRLGLRLHGPGEAGGDRVLRPRADGLDQARDGGELVGLLVQRLRLLDRDHARARRARAPAERAPHPERDRRREARAGRLSERAGSAACDVARQLRGGATRPASSGVPRAYVDQLERSQGLGTDRVTAARTALANAERASGRARRSALNALAGQLTQDAARSSDSKKVLALQAAVRDLAR